MSLPVCTGDFGLFFFSRVTHSALEIRITSRTEEYGGRISHIHGLAPRTEHA